MTTLLIVESNLPTQKPLAPGFAAALAGVEGDLRFRTVAPYAGETADLGGIDGVVFTGSAVDWSTDAPQAAPLRAAMEAAFAAGLPVYGSCNGMNLGATVLGGAVGPSPNGREDGVAAGITPTEAGRAHPMLAGRTGAYASLCVHRDEVTRLPEGAVTLSGNAHSPVQAFAHEQGGVCFWGTQYHPEHDVAELADVLEEIGGATPGKIAALRRADADAGAAAEWGAAPGDLAPDTHRTELRNWVAMLRGRTET